tara:strand:- start:217 stop:375 length:159 start_codon:yes stop_codon:yes gene_type:complete
MVSHQEKSQQFEYLYNERLGILLDDPEAIEVLVKQQALKEAQQLIKEYYPNE